jgi:hypothetical protein
MDRRSLIQGQWWHDPTEERGVGVYEPVEGGGGERAWRTSVGKHFPGVYPPSPDPPV